MVIQITYRDISAKNLRFKADESILMLR